MTTSRTKRSYPKGGAHSSDTESDDGLPQGWKRVRRPGEKVYMYTDGEHTAGNIHDAWKLAATTVPS